MTITITPAGGSATTLCHGSARAEGNAVGPSGFAVRCAPGLIRRAYVEDTGVRYERGGNDEVTGSFSVAIRCASLAAAATKVSDIIASTPRAGQMALGSLTLYNAGLVDISAQQRGRAVFATYSFAGSPTQEVTV
jgi:hypothetical protein